MNENDDTIRATKLETLGAWLGLWTPPRGVAVPPVPWRRVALAAAALVLAAAAAAFTVAPAIDDAKDEGRAERQRELDQRAAERRARTAKMQEPRFGTIPALSGERRAEGSAGGAKNADGAGGAEGADGPAGGADGARARAVAAVGVAIGEDARKRFSPKAQAATCEVAPGVDPDRQEVAYTCLSATSEIEGAGPQTGARGRLGYPYRAIVDFERNRYAFCRINPQPSEKALKDPREIVGLPKACLLEAR